MITAGSQPDWYMGFVEGGIRIMPNWETHIWGTTWSWNVVIPGLGIMGLLFGLMAIYPFVEEVGDRRQVPSTTSWTDRATRRPGQRSASRP